MFRLASCTLVMVTISGLAMAQDAPATSEGSATQPNILVIMGDDIGQGNISAYTRGLMGYTTPNIDSIANDGAIFTDYYAEQSCTAGRSTFITGQSTFRTGLSKVGLPGANAGLQDVDVTLASALKDHGYATGQFGKNHLGDRDEMLPTQHGFDEFFGNLYHLNAEEEPEQPDYPKDPEFKKKFGPRGVIHSFADGKIEDTGPLTKKRMETIDEEVNTKALDFMERAAKAEKPDAERFRDLAQLREMGVALAAGLVDRLERCAREFELAAGFERDRALSGRLDEPDDVTGIDDRIPAEHLTHAFEQRPDAVVAAIGNRRIAVDVERKLFVLRSDPPPGFGLLALRHVADQRVKALDGAGIGGVTRHHYVLVLRPHLRRRASDGRKPAIRSSEKS